MMFLSGLDLGAKNGKFLAIYDVCFLFQTFLSCSGNVAF